MLFSLKLNLMESTDKSRRRGKKTIFFRDRDLEDNS